MSRVVPAPVCVGGGMTCARAGPTPRDSCRRQPRGCKTPRCMGSPVLICGLPPTTVRAHRQVSAARGGYPIRIRVGIEPGADDRSGGFVAGWRSQAGQEASGHITGPGRRGRSFELCCPLLGTSAGVVCHRHTSAPPYVRGSSPSTSALPAPAHSSPARVSTRRVPGEVPAPSTHGVEGGESAHRIWRTDHPRPVGGQATGAVRADRWITHKGPPAGRSNPPPGRTWTRRSRHAPTAGRERRPGYGPGRAVRVPGSQRRRRTAVSIGVMVRSMNVMTASSASWCCPCRAGRARGRRSQPGPGAVPPARGVPCQGDAGRQQLRRREGVARGRRRSSAVRGGEARSSRPAGPGDRSRRTSRGSSPEPGRENRVPRRVSRERERRCSGRSPRSGERPACHRPGCRNGRLWRRARCPRPCQAGWCGGSVSGW